MIHYNERLPRLTDDSAGILADLARDSQPDADDGADADWGDYYPTREPGCTVTPWAAMADVDDAGEGCF